MTLATEEDLKEAAHQAQWTACYRLRAFATTASQGSWNMGELAAASLAAGEAWAYYQASDLIATLSGKLKEQKAKAK